MIKRIKQFSSKRLLLCPKSTVPDSLAVTPREMDQCRENCIPIHSEINPESFVDGDLSNQMILPLECTRGVDVVELWNASKTASVKIAKHNVKLSN